MIVVVGTDALIVGSEDDVAMTESERRLPSRASGGGRTVTWTSADSPPRSDTVRGLMSTLHPPATGVVLRRRVSVTGLPVASLARLRTVRWNVAGRPDEARPTSGRLWPSWGRRSTR